MLTNLINRTRVIERVRRNNFLHVASSSIRKHLEITDNGGVRSGCNDILENSQLLGSCSVGHAGFVMRVFPIYRRHEFPSYASTVLGFELVDWPCALVVALGRKVHPLQTRQISKTYPGKHSSVPLTVT